jgi:hypothetical protein
VRADGSPHFEAETADSWSLYDHPTLYERIFAFRDIPKEVSSPSFLCASQQHAQRQTLCGQTQVSFLFDLHRRRPQHSSSLETFLEIGCEAGYQEMELNH